MKYIYYIINFFFLMFAVQASFAQGNYHLTSNCANFNAFMDNGNMVQIEPYTYNHYPNGTLMIDPAQLYSVTADDLLNLMSLDAGTSFSFVKEFPSRFRADEVSQKYQQYFNGVIVEGGGYTGTFYRQNIGVGAGPCDPLAIFSPHILTGITVNTNPTVSSSSVPAILQTGPISYLDLVVSHDLNKQCNYVLAWKATYMQNGQKTSWVDAHTGTILKTVDSAMGIKASLATTGPNYPPNPILNDATIGGTTFLQSPDGQITLYDFGTDCPETTLNTDEWEPNLVPSTSNSEWGTETTPEAYQAFYVTSLVIDAFESLDINFESVNVASCLGFGAFSLFDSTIEETYIYIGLFDGDTGALFDILGHELGHTFLNQYLIYDTPGGQSLHEGIADILGTYIESIITGSTDWVIGDDESNVASLTGRDLQNPEFDCFTDVSHLGGNQGEQYDRGQPLGHWFYLASQGDNQSIPPIPAIGMDAVIEILIEALQEDGFGEGNTDYPDLMAATLIVVENDFGRCSDEFLAIARAWEAICVDTGLGTGVPDCNFSILNTGSDIVCEEDDFLHLYLGGGLATTDYNWRIHGGGSFVTTGNQQGNNVYGTTSLIITDLPKYPYYPQYLIIEVYSPTLGTDYTERKRITLIDCNGDDPTCKEYYGLKRSNEDISPISDSIAKTIRGFDLTGRLVFERDIDEFNRQDLKTNELMILVSYDANGQMVEVKKSFIGH